MKPPDKNGAESNKKDQGSGQPAPMQNKANGFKISGNWKQQAAELKGKFPGLTDADIKWETGQEEQLVNRLSLRLNKSKLEVLTILKKGNIKN